jgi:flagellar basal body-associated protein FliL
MAKDKGKQDEDSVNVDDIAEGKDETAQAVPAASPLANLMKSRLVKILGYSLVAILLIVVSVVISSLVVKNYAKTRLSLEDQRWEEKKPDPLSVIAIQEFKLSTADVDEPGNIRMNLSLGYDAKDVEVVAELNARKVEIIDMVNRLVSELRKDQVDEVGERDELKERIMDAINNKLQSGEVKAVYFTEFSVM